MRPHRGELGQRSGEGQRRRTNRSFTNKNKLAGRRRRALWQLTRRLGSALQPRTRLFPIGYKGGYITFNVQRAQIASIRHAFLLRPFLSSFFSSDVSASFKNTAVIAETPRGPFLPFQRKALQKCREVKQRLI